MSDLSGKGKQNGSVLFPLDSGSNNQLLINKYQFFMQLYINLFLMEYLEKGDFTNILFLFQIKTIRIKYY